jgi:hypothetical protein
VKNGNPLLFRRGAGSERSAARLLFDCLIVEVTAPDGIDSRWVQQAVENEIEEQFGKRLTLCSINEDEALHYLEAMPDATHGALQLATGVALFYHLARIV